MRLGDLPIEDRPRERMQRDGPAALTAEELLALVLGTGRGSGEDALQLATRLLGEMGGADALGRTPLAALMGVHGVGPVKAARIAAAFELGTRGLAPPLPLAPSGGREPGGPASVAAPPAPPALPEWQQVALALRGQVAIGERALLAYRADQTAPPAWRPTGDRAEAPLTLALGQSLGAETRAGAVLARLLAADAGAAWWVVGIRPGGEPQRRERDAADRILQAAALVGLEISGVLLLTGKQARRLAGGERGGEP